MIRMIIKHTQPVPPNQKAMIILIMWFHPTIEKLRIDGKQFIIVAILLFFLLQPKLYAQDLHFEKQNLYGELHLFQGDIWAHHNAINYLVTGHPRGFGFKVGQQSFGKKAWQHSLRMPRYGLAYQFSTLGSDVLGLSHALYPYIDITSVKARRFIWSYTLGAGIGYVDKPFHAQTNVMNIVSGSHWNAFLSVCSSIGLDIGSRGTCILQGGLFHLSNGNTSEPNWGVNTLYASVGYRYQLGYKKDKLSPADSVFYAKINRWALYAGSGFKEEPPMDGRRFFVSDLHITYWRYFKPSSAWGVSFSTFYDQSVKKMLWRGKAELEMPLDDYHVDNIQYWSFAIGAGYGLNLDPVFFSVEAGAYIYTATKRNIYNRWLLELKIYRNLKVFGGLKSYFGRAEFIEYGVVYDLFIQKTKKTGMF